MPDLTFSSKGTAQVLADQQRLKEGAKAVAALYKEENKEVAQLGRDATRIFQQTRTESEKLRQHAEKLRAVIANTKLPDIDRAKAADALKRVETKLKDVEGAGNKAGSSLRNAFGDSAKSLLGNFATVAGGITAGVAIGIKAITDELRAAQELANKAAATQISVAASRNVVIRNLPGASDTQINQVLRENAELAAKTGVSEKSINQARASALSASGGNVAASLKATEIAARFLSDRPDEIGDFAGSLLDLSKVTGVTDARVNLGLLSAVGGLSRITDQRQQATNIPAALIGAREFGFSTAEAASIFSAITTASGDITGAQSGTATIQLAKQLENYDGPNGELAGLSTGEKLRRLQRDSGEPGGLRDKFFQDASFEAKAYGPIRALLSNSNSEAAKAFEENLRAIPEVSGLGARGDQALAAFSVNPLERRARVQRGLATLEEEALIAADGGFLNDEEVESLRNILNSVTGGGAGVGISAARGLDRKLSIDEAIGLVQGKIPFLQIDQSLGVDNKESIDRLERLIEILEQSNSEQKRQTEEIKKNGGIPVTAG